MWRFAEVKLIEVNIYQIGIVINLWAFRIAASPDQTVYNHIHKFANSQSHIETSSSASA